MHTHDLRPKKKNAKHHTSFQSATPHEMGRDYHDLTFEFRGRRRAKPGANRQAQLAGGPLERIAFIRRAAMPVVGNDLKRGG